MDIYYFIQVSLPDCYIQGGYFHTSFTVLACMIDSITRRLTKSQLSAGAHNSLWI